MNLEDLQLLLEGKEDLLEGIEESFDRKYDRNIMTMEEFENGLARTTDS